MWTAFPDPLPVGHPANIALGTNVVTVSVGGLSTPVEGAQVCLWKDDETYVVGHTDSEGNVALPVDTATTGDMLLTVTHHNRQPFLATIPVTAHALYVGVEATLVDDDSSGDSSGNESPQ